MDDAEERQLSSPYIQSSRGDLSIHDLPWDVMELILLQPNMTVTNIQNFLLAIGKNDYSPYHQEPKPESQRSFWEKKFQISFPDLYDETSRRHTEIDGSKKHCAQLWFRLFEMRSKLNEDIMETLGTIRKKCLSEELERNLKHQDNLVESLLMADPNDVRFPRSDRETELMPDVTTKMVRNFGDCMESTIPAMDICTFEILPKFDERRYSSGISEQPEISRQPIFSAQIFQHDWVNEFHIGQFSFERRCTLTFSFDAIVAFCKKHGGQQRLHGRRNLVAQSLIKYANIARDHIQQSVSARIVRSYMDQDGSVDSTECLLAVLQGSSPAYCGLDAKVRKVVTRLALELRKCSPYETGSHYYQLIIREINVRLREEIRKNFSVLRLVDSLAFRLRLTFGRREVLKMNGRRGYLLDYGLNVISFFLVASKLDLPVDMYKFNLTFSNGDGRQLTSHILLPCISYDDKIFVVLPNLHQDCSAVIVDTSQMHSQLPELLFGLYFADVTFPGFGAVHTIEISPIEHETGAPLQNKFFQAPIRPILESYFSNENIMLDLLKASYNVKEIFSGTSFLKDMYWSVASNGATATRRTPEVNRVCLYLATQRCSPCNLRFDGPETNSVTPWRGIQYERKRSSATGFVHPWSSSVLPVGSIVRYKKRALTQPDREENLQNIVSLGVIVSWEVQEQKEGAESKMRVTYHLVPSDHASDVTGNRFFTRLNCAGIVSEMELAVVNLDFMNILLNQDSRLMKYFDEFDGLFLVPHNALLDFFPDDLAAQNNLRRFVVSMRK